MAESLVQVTEGVGKKLHTWSRTVGANTVEDEFMLPGEYPLATYTIVADAVSLATAASHTLQIMAGAALNVRIRRIRFRQVANATAAVVGLIDLVRLTTAGTGGTAITPRPPDSADAAAGATAMTLPTVKGTEGVQLWGWRVMLRQAFLATAAQADEQPDWVPAPSAKGFLIPAGAANGVAIKSTGGVAGATVSIYVDIVETAFV